MTASRSGSDSPEHDNDADVVGDPMAIFSAAKDAERMADYMLGLAREHATAKDHRAWVAEYDAAQALSPTR